MEFRFIAQKKSLLFATSNILSYICRLNDAFA